MGPSNSKPKVQSTPLITQYDKSVLELKTQRDKLNRSRKHLELVMEKELETAKLLHAKNKEKALLCLRRRKLQEKMLHQISDLLDNVHRMINEMEFATIQAEVLASLKQGSSALSELNRQMNIADVEKVIGDTAEAIAYQQEVSAALARSLTNESELECVQELESIQKIAAAEEINVHNLVVPAHRLPTVEVQNSPDRETPVLA